MKHAARSPPIPGSRCGARRRLASRWAVPAAACRRASGSISSRRTRRRATRFTRHSTPRRWPRDCRARRRDHPRRQRGAAIGEPFWSGPTWGAGSTTASDELLQARARAETAAARSGDRRQRRPLRPRGPSTSPAALGPAAATPDRATAGGSRRSSSSASAAWRSKTKSASCSARSSR